VRLTLTLSFLFSWTRCAEFRDSPFSDTLQRGERNLNAVNLNRMSGVDVEADGVIRIAVIADSHGNYDDLEHVIKEINAQPAVDFVVNLGDFTNSGYNFEYDQFLNSLSKLGYPNFTVMGNHDVIGAGDYLFAKAFGSSNFYFESNNYRFLFWNSINLEIPDAFNPEWMSATVRQSAKPVVLFTHVSLDDEERFRGFELRTLKASITDRKLYAVLHGHKHNYHAGLQAGTLILKVPRVEGGRWIMFEIHPKGFHFTRMESGEDNWVTFKPSF
jgi:predicted phosphodiesterase